MLPTQTRLFSSPTSADIRIEYLSRRRILHHSNDMDKPAQPLDFNTLHSVHIVEELIELTVGSDAEKILRRIFLSNTFKVIASVRNY